VPSRSLSEEREVSRTFPRTLSHPLFILGRLPQPSGRRGRTHDEAECSTCEQLRLEGPDTHTFDVVPADGGGWSTLGTRCAPTGRRSGRDRSWADQLEANGHACPNRGDISSDVSPISDNGLSRGEIDI
jgi:hypothetical protein